MHPLQVHAKASGKRHRILIATRKKEKMESNDGDDKDDDYLHYPRTPEEANIIIN